MNHPSNPSQRQLAAIILAAGKGTRMNPNPADGPRPSATGAGLGRGRDMPKVVLEVAGMPMVRWVVEAYREIGRDPIVLIVSDSRGPVRDVFIGDDRDLLFVEQEPQLGTGHAVMQARDVFDLDEFPHLFDQSDVFVLAGDGPLLRAEILRMMLEAHRRTDAAATLATATIDDPTGYGRIIRDSEGRFRGIVEHRDATPEQLAIREINPSYYLFRARPLFEALDQIDNRNAKGEYYLTDVFPILLERGERVEVVDAVPPECVLSINTPEQLEEVGRILEARLERLGAPKRMTT